jgi:hypothetical protein
MFKLSYKQIQFLPEHERVLRDLVIDESGPGTILHDFEALLAFLKERDLPVTGTQQLPLKALPEINARLARPLQFGLKRPLQKSYPHIHGLYLLVRASGLTHIEGPDKKPRLVVDDIVRRAWENLNPTERYCTLLETWLLRGHPQIIDEGRYRSFVIPETFMKVRDFVSSLPDGGIQIAGDREAESHLRYIPDWHNLGLLELFGLLSVQHGPPEPGKGWHIERICRTPLGEALVALLHIEFFGDLTNVFQLEAEGKGNVPIGALQPVLQPYFPAWENNLFVPEWTFRAGTCIFRVSLGQIWRRIAIPAEQSLDALAVAILDAVDFDQDHLYLFSYRNRCGIQAEVHHPYMDEGPWTDQVLVGDVPLRIGQTMTYVFDFGDWWEFDVTLERIDPDMSIETPVILEEHGEPPEQYRSWGD